MKYLIYVFSLVLLVGCVGSDILDDTIPEVVRITSTAKNIPVGETYQFKATFFNNIGLPEEHPVLWFSDDESVVTISSNGLATGVKEGVTKIKVRVVLDDNLSVEDEKSITIITGESTTPDDGSMGEEMPENPTTGDSENLKEGTIATTSSYVLSGDFTLQEIPGTNNLELTFSDSYVADSGLPGLYLYFTNNTNSINGAHEVGMVVTFKGEHSYVLSNVGINDFSSLLYWCKPFGIKVGNGEFNN